MFSNICRIKYSQVGTQNEENFKPNPNSGSTIHCEHSFANYYSIFSTEKYVYIVIVFIRNYSAPTQIYGG